MKRSDLSKVVGAGILAASLAVVPLTLPASAQTTTDTTPSTGVDTRRTDTNTADYNTRGDDDNNDWGWLGLLGLIGLAGLLPRKREEPVRYEVNREPDATTRSGYPR